MGIRRLVQTAMVLLAVLTLPAETRAGSCPQCDDVGKWLADNAASCQQHGARTPSTCAGDLDCIRWSSDCAKQRQLQEECLAQCAKPAPAPREKTSHPPRGFLGAQIGRVTEEARQKAGIDHTHGALVIKATEGQPAALAGLLAGDIILVFGKSQILDYRELGRMAAEQAPGSTQQMVVLRGGALVLMTVTMGSRPD